MARIIISGSTYTQSRGRMALRPIVCMSGYLEPAIRAHHDLQMLLPEEIDLEKDKPDMLLLGMAPPSSLTARFTSQLYSIYGQAKQAHIPVVWFVDDKAINQIPAHMGSWVRGFEKRVGALYGTGRKMGSAEFALSMKPVIMEHFEAFLAGQLTEPIMVHMFGADAGKDPETEKHFMGNRTIYFDTSGTVNETEPLKDVPANKKKFQWMLANLGNYGYEWINKRFGGFEKFKWPVITFGKIDKVQQPRASQEDMLNIHYPESWGIMSPSYPMKVGRLYRTRFVHSALANSVMLCTHDGTINYFGDWYKVNPVEVEDMSLSELQTLAQHQADTFWAKTWTKDRLIKCVDDVVAEALQ